MYTYACLWHTHRKKFDGSFVWLVRNLYSPRSSLQVLSFCSLYKELAAFLTGSVAKGYFLFGVIKF